MHLPGITVAGREAHEASGKVVCVDEAAELAAGMLGIAHGFVVVANDSLGYQGGEVVRITPANTLNSDGDVGGGDRVVPDSDI